MSESRTEVVRVRMRPSDVEAFRDLANLRAETSVTLSGLISWAVARGMPRVFDSLTAYRCDGCNAVLPEGSAKRAVSEELLCPACWLSHGDECAQCGHQPEAT